MRARGLKPVIGGLFEDEQKSRPMRARGLKLFISVFIVVDLVAPHAGAWIETTLPDGELFQGIVAPHAGAWIET